MVQGMPWYQISTHDFVHFTEHGEMLARGTLSDQDLYVFTGSVIEGQGCFHIFYTGHNPYLRQHGKPEQAVMHAVSDDLLKWRRSPRTLSSLRKLPTSRTTGVTLLSSAT